MRTVQPDALVDAVASCTESALAAGALRPIDTRETVIEDDGVSFVVRTVSSLARKPAPAPASARGNPFLPPDPALTVGALSATHLAVLNKFPVVARHLLLVTREFVPQEALLDRADFQAFARCLHAADWLGFYNGGRDAGASQPHKHLQLVPLPLAGGPWAVPMEALFDTWAQSGRVARLLRLPFSNAFAAFDDTYFDAPEDAADRLLDAYLALLDARGLGAEPGDVLAAEPSHRLAAEPGDRAPGEQRRRAGPYNLLLTRRWMVLVPRARESVGTMSVNALGFAGSLFARDDAELRVLRELGPMDVLRRVAVAAGGASAGRLPN